MTKELLQYFIPIPLILTSWLITHLVITWTNRYFIKKSHIKKDVLKTRWRLISFLSLTQLYLISPITYPKLQNTDVFNWPQFFRIFFIFNILLLIDQLMRMINRIVKSRYDISKEDNLTSRKVITRFDFIRRLIFTVVVFVAVGIVFLDFAELEKIGKSLLASAGVASVIIGFSAQKALGNLIAGIQIAFTQPIRIDDAVLVENEWGWIEEINFTYVVVRVWDQRRVILPIKYFIEEPFQNWTRKSAQILCPVVLYLDYRAPIAPIREAFYRILNESTLWDRDKKVFQVIDATEKTIQVRALMTAKNSPQGWDLRCEIREKLVEYIRENHPESLPTFRVETQQS